MNKKIFLTGASGFVGLHLLKNLSSQGHHITCLLRGESLQKIRLLNLENVNLIEGDFINVNQWSEQIAGHDIFINTVGIIRENKTSTFDKVHYLAPIEIFKACKKHKVKKIIQLSALGSDDGAKSKYHLTKKAADHFLSELGVSFTILRPSFIYGPNDQSMSFFSILASFPLHLLPSHGNYRLSPLYIDDLIRVMTSSLEANENMTINLGGPNTLTYKELLRQLAHILGVKYFIQIPIHSSIINLSCKFTDFFKIGPINSDEWSMLQRENYCNSDALAKAMNQGPISFKNGIHRAQEVLPYKFAHLKWLVPFTRFTIAFIWAYTGIISLFFTPREFSLQLLSNVGVVGPYATPVLFFTASFEIVLGLFILCRKWVGFTTLIQLLLITGFTLILTIYSSEFWAHPFGPLSKNIPLISAILFLWIYENKKTRFS